MGRDGRTDVMVTRLKSVSHSVNRALVSDWRAMAGRPEEEGMVVAWQLGSDWSEDVTDVWTEDSEPSVQDICDRKKVQRSMAAGR